MLVIEAQDFLDQMDAMIRSAVARALTAIPATTATQQPTSNDLLTIKQAAEMLDVCVATLHEWLRRGILSSIKIGGRTYLLRSTVLTAGIQRQRTTKPGRKKSKPPSATTPS